MPRTRNLYTNNAGRTYTELEMAQKFYDAMLATGSTHERYDSWRSQGQRCFANAIFNDEHSMSANYKHMQATLFGLGRHS